MKLTKLKQIRYLSQSFKKIFVPRCLRGGRTNLTYDQPDIDVISRKVMIQVSFGLCPLKSEPSV